MSVSIRTSLFSLFLILISHAGFSQNGLDFDGVDDQVDCGNDPSIEITGTTITLEAWIYPTSWTNEVWRGNIINKGDNGATGYMLRAGATGTLNFNLGNGITWTETSSNINELTLNTWQHVAATYDGAMMRTYVNGIPVDSLATTISLDNAPSANLGIGVDMAFSRYFPGIIDEVRIWDIQRTEQEIINSMNTELCTQTGLKAYYQFNSGVASGSNTAITTLTDLSGNGNTGTLTGFNLTGASSNWVTGATLALAGPSSGVDVQTPLCNQITWIDGITYTADNNTATHTIANAAGCDSVVTLDLTIGPNQSSSSTDIRNECGVLQWIDGVFYTSNNNTATYTLPNAVGCDSVITLNLTILGSTSGTDVQTSCSAYTWINGNTYTTSNNTATYTLPNSVGCDSIVSLDLTITTIEGTDVQVSCGDSYTWIDGNTYTSPNNSATFMTLTNAGCDSLVTLDLTFNSIDVSTTVAQVSEITVGASGATYQWLDCDNNYAIIPAANNKTYIATSNGSYAAQVTQNGCTDTSECVEITSLSINSNSNQNQPILVFPNPTTGQVSISLPNAIKTGDINIIDVNGKRVQCYTFNNSNSPITLDLNVAKGIYFVEVVSEHQTLRHKIVKL